MKAKRKHKIQILVTEDEWMALNRKLDSDILKGLVPPRTSISKYYGDVLKNYLKQ